jgi:HlyD family secretion protein
MRKLLVLCIIIGFILIGCKDESNLYNGYIDADLTYLSGDFSGQLINLLVSRGMEVNKKQLLFQLEQLNEIRTINSGLQTQKDLIADRNQIISKLAYANINYKRQKELYADGVGSVDAVDQARQNRDVLQYQLSSSAAQIKNNEILIAQKEWQRDRKQNISPDSGIIYDTYFTDGEYVQGGQPILSLITAKNIKAIFFVSEAKLSQIKLNQKVKIYTDVSSESGKSNIKNKSNKNSNPYMIGVVSYILHSA